MQKRNENFPESTLQRRRPELLYEVAPAREGLGPVVLLLRQSSPLVRRFAVHFASGEGAWRRPPHLRLGGHGLTPQRLRG